jgi:uncharacterized membrane protein
MGTTDVPVELVVAAWPDAESAGEAMQELREAKKEHLIGIRDAATIVVDEDGKMRIRDTKDMGGGKGAVIGGVLGAGLGLITGGVGWLLLGGGAVGALAAKARDGGLPDERLKELGARMTPNSSAIVAVIEHRWVADFERDMEAQAADVVRAAVGNDLATQLSEGSAITYSAADVEGDVLATRETVPQPRPSEEAAPRVTA